MSRAPLVPAVLVVDAHPGDAQVTVEALRRLRPEGRCEIAVSAEAALAALRAGPPPSLLLLDPQLPDGDGLALLQRLKGDPDWRLMPVVVYASASDEASVARAYDLHANCYVSKPPRHEDYFGRLAALERFWFRTALLPTWLVRQPG